MTAPDISVVVPTYRRPDLVDRCLASLVEQSADPYEVVVVDDGSGDRTVEIIDEWAARQPRIRTFHQPENRGPAAARNRGIREATSELVLFIDDDVVAPRNLVARHLAIHAEVGGPKIGVLGRMEWDPSVRVTAFMRWLDRSGLQFAYDTWLQPGPVDPPYGAFYTCNLSMPRQLLLDHGGFDERFPYPAYEDIELAYRLAADGFTLVYRPEALAFHGRSIDLRTFAERMGKVAESAEILSHVQPEFPVDHGPAERGWVRRRARLVLRTLAPVAALLGRERLLARHYQAQIAAAYREGRARGRARLASSA